MADEIGVAEVPDWAQVERETGRATMEAINQLWLLAHKLNQQVARRVQQIVSEDLPPLQESIGRFFVVTKTADETVNNSDVLQNDNELTFEAEANTTYLVNLYLRLNGGIAADYKLDLSVPAGAAYNWAPIGEGGGGGLGFFWSPKNTVQGSQQALASGEIQINGSANTPQGCHLVALVMIAGTAGSVTLRWAQNTATAADSKVLQHSTMVVARG